MHIGFKAGQLAVEVLGETQIVDDGLVETFAGDQQRDARWVRRQQHRGDAAFQLFHRHALDFAVGHFGEGVGRAHRRLHFRQIDLGGDAGHVVLAVELVDALAQIAQADALVLRIFGDELWHHPPHGLVLVEVVLELLQQGDQRVPAALGDADGEHDEEAVQPGLFHYHAVLGQVLGDDGGGNAHLFEAAVHIQARGQHRGLDRVQHIEAVLDAGETVPALVRTQLPLGRVADAVVGQVVRAPDAEPPVAAVFLVHLAHGAAEVQRLHQRFFHQRLSARLFHHRRGHVAAGDDGILRAGGGVHQIGLVEPGGIQLTLLRVLHQDLRGLADAGQQLVGGLGGEDQAVLAARPPFADGVEVSVEIMEAGVGQPGFVKVQGVDLAVQQMLDFLHVVENAVVGGLGQRQDARLGLRVLGQRFAGEGIGLDFLLDVVELEFGLRNRADDAVMVARRHQEHRDRAGHHDGVQIGFVAVAVHQHDVAGRHAAVPDDLVGGGGAVGDEEQMVGVEDARGVALGGGDGAGVVQQLAQFVHRVADVGAQHVLAEELVEHLTHRALQEGDATGVAGAVPGVRAIVGVVHQGAEERRRQAVQIAFGFADDVAGDEFRRVLVHVDEAVQLAQDVVGNVARGAGFAVQIDRDVRIAATDFRDEAVEFAQRFLRRVLGMEFLVVYRQDEAGGAALLLGEGSQIAVAGVADHAHAFRLHGGGEFADAGAAGVFRAEVLVDDHDGEMKTHT